MGKGVDSLRDSLLWTYSRGTWQYDVICALILAFIFFIPPSFFHRKGLPMKVDSSGKDALQSAPHQPEQPTQAGEKPQRKDKP